MLDGADDNSTERVSSNASVSSDTDEKLYHEGQLYVSFPERHSDDGNDGKLTKLTRHSKSLPIENRNVSKTEPYPDQSSTKETLSYKETLFEKVILAPIVNVRDLRKLGWNGEI